MSISIVCHNGFFFTSSLHLYYLQSEGGHAIAAARILLRIRSQHGNSYIIIDNRSPFEESSYVSTYCVGELVNECEVDRFA